MQKKRGMFWDGGLRLDQPKTTSLWKNLNPTQSNLNLDPEGQPNPTEPAFWPWCSTPKIGSGLAALDCQAIRDWCFFSEIFLLVHLSTLFCKKNEGYKKERKKIWNKRQFHSQMSTLSKMKIKQIITFFHNFHYWSTCPHFFVKIVKST